MLCLRLLEWSGRVTWFESMIVQYSFFIIHMSFHLPIHYTLAAKINNMGSMKRSDMRTPNIVEVDFSLRRRKGPASPGTPAACASTLLCLPPAARPLPPQWPAPLHVPSLVRTHPRRSQSHIAPQAQRPVPRFCIFPPLRPGSPLRLIPPPV